MNMNKILEQYIELYNNLIMNENNKIPLCAAETYISSFCKQALNSEFEGKYSFVDKNGNNSFIGGEYVFQLNELLSKQCKIVFNANYTNADSLTGINCFSVCAMSLLSRNDRVLVTLPSQGGHASIPIILDSLGIAYDEIPYDYKKYQVNYYELNKLCNSNKYNFIIFCQSDVINPPDISRISITGNMGIIYDGTQTLGLIAGKILDNPLNYDNVVLIGGTHKTLPAPSCGLIMTNNMYYAEKLKNNITPNYLRNTQPNHIAALLLSLIEEEQFGPAYQHHVVKTANLFGNELEKLNFKLAKLTFNTYTYTHQLFMLMSKMEAEKYYNTAQKFNITLNKKHKELFNFDGIRIGTQQIARYNWQQEEISQLAQMLYLLQNAEENSEQILKLRALLISKKIPQFEYEDISIE